MRTITIGKNDSNQRLDKFLSKRFKTMPKSLMYKYIRTKYIKLNGKKTTAETFLSENDVLTLYIKDEFFENNICEYDFMKAGKKLDIIYEDENIILINKEKGVLVHQDKKYDSDCIISRLKRYLYEKGEYNPAEDKAFSPALVNRIDRNTTGIIIGAKNAQALRVLNEKLKNREIKKYYLCVVKGKPKKDKAVLTDYLYKNESTNKVTISSKQLEDYKEIITSYKLLCYDKTKNVSLCEVELKTGRTHQIRAHMSYIGNPIIGDEKYGDKNLNKKLGHKHQLLCSYKLRFFFESDADKLAYLNNKEFSIDNVWETDNDNIKI